MLTISARVKEKGQIGKGGVNGMGGRKVTIIWKAKRDINFETTLQAIKEWTSIHVFCRTAELAFNQDSTSSRKLNRISEYHKNTIFTILIIYLFNKPAALIWVLNRI